MATPTGTHSEAYKKAFKPNSLLPGYRFREEGAPFHPLSHFLLCGAVSGNLRRLLTDFGEIS
jgi:hypothetical protein